VGISILNQLKEIIIMKNWIKEIIDSGRVIILDDSSKWEVDTLDRIEARFWMRLDNVTIAGNKMIKHGHRDKTITVKKLI
jgi:hypothetical protein